MESLKYIEDTCDRQNIFEKVVTLLDSFENNLENAWNIELITRNRKFEIKIFNRQKKKKEENETQDIF